MNNNNNLYNILKNFNKLSESDTPHPAAQPKPKTLLESTNTTRRRRFQVFKQTLDRYQTLITYSISTHY